MNITLDNIGKRYASKHWVFKDLNDSFLAGDRVAITGGNGSGKSTLLQTIGGIINPSKGQVIYGKKDNTIDKESAFQRINFTAPYLDVIDEFSVQELLEFHFKFRKLRTLKNSAELLEILYLKGHESKLVKNLSSGMRQRLKLGLVIHSASDVILLDEPTTNLDEKGIEWYHNQISTVPTEVTIIIASNQKQEYSFCDKIKYMNSEFIK